mgnify:CR=1 FL=1
MLDSARGRSRGRARDGLRGRRGGVRERGPRHPRRVHGRPALRGAARDPGLLAAPRGGRLEIWGTTKVPHFNRRVLASMLEIPVEQHPAADGRRGWRVPASAASSTPRTSWCRGLPRGRVGPGEVDRGSLGAPGRDEPFAAPDPHAISAAFDRDHRLLAIADEVWHDTGAYIRTHGVAGGDLTLSMLPVRTAFPAYRGTRARGAHPRTPCGTYRGPGRYEGTFARERLLDLAAHDLGLDPLGPPAAEPPVARRAPAPPEALGDRHGDDDRCRRRRRPARSHDRRVRVRDLARRVGPPPGAGQDGGDRRGDLPGEERARAARARRRATVAVGSGPGHRGGHVARARASRPSSRRSPRSGSVSEADDVTVVLGDT